MKDNTGIKTWNKKMQRKKEREEVLARFAAIEAEKKQKREDLKKRQKLNKILREENERKSEIVQVVSAITFLWFEVNVDDLASIAYAFLDLIMLLFCPICQSTSVSQFPCSVFTLLY